MALPGDPRMVFGLRPISGAMSAFLTCRMHPKAGTYGAGNTLPRRMARSPRIPGRDLAASKRGKIAQKVRGAWRETAGRFGVL